MRSGKASLNAPAKESEFTHEITGVKAIVPKTFKEFIDYVAEALGISEEKVAGLLIGDSLSTLSSYLPGKYAGEWLRVMGFKRGVNQPTVEMVERVLPGLAVMFTMNKLHEEREKEAQRRMKDVIVAKVTGRRAEIVEFLEKKTGKPIEEIIGEALEREYQLLKEPEE